MSTLVTRFSPVELRQLHRMVNGLSHSADFFFENPYWRVALQKRTQEKMARKTIHYTVTMGMVPGGTFLLSNFSVKLHVITDLVRDPLTDLESPLDNSDHLERVSVVVPTEFIKPALPDSSFTLISADTLGLLVRVEWVREQVVDWITIKDPIERRVPLLATLRSDRAFIRKPTAYGTVNEYYLYDPNRWPAWRPEETVLAERAQAQMGGA